MLTAEQIPHIAFVAADRVLSQGGNVDEALAAAINAWPGMWTSEVGDGYLASIIHLPLQQKETSE